MALTVLRVELARSMVEQIAACSDGSSIGTMISEALRATLPALAQMRESPMASGSQPGIAIRLDLDPGLSNLRATAAYAPPPARFTQPVQLAVPAELWSQVDRERVRLRLSIDDLVAWAWRNRRLDSAPVSRRADD